MLKRIAATALALIAFAGPVFAQGKYPERDLTLIVPWAPGGGTDAVARTLVKNAKQHLGVGMNVVNRTGGTGAVGMQAAASARADATRSG